MLLLFCFLILEYTLSAQSFNLAEDGSYIQVYPLRSVNTEDFAVYAGEHRPLPTAEIPAMLGSYVFEQDTLRFTPAFSFRTGRTYILCKGKETLLQFSLPQNTSITPTVATEVFPSPDTLPANLLKMYIYFSAPMQEGFAYQHLSLLNSLGDTLEHAFLKLMPELWDEKSQRLTLWFDPGRLKRDLILNREMGTPLSAGKKYELRISADWKDQQGQKLGEGFRKSFFVAEADRERPELSDWSLHSPKIHSQEVLKLDFGEPMDQALALAALTVWKGDQQIAGKAKLCSKERVWEFYPKEHWAKGTYRIEVEARLEDLAGNNLNRLFDRDLLRDTTSPQEKDLYQIPFHINP